MSPILSLWSEEKCFDLSVYFICPGSDCDGQSSALQTYLRWPKTPSQVTITLSCQPSTVSKFVQISHEVTYQLPKLLDQYCKFNKGVGSGNYTYDITTRCRTYTSYDCNCCTHKPHDTNLCTTTFPSSDVISQTQIDNCRSQSSCTVNVRRRVISCDQDYTCPVYGSRGELYTSRCYGRWVRVSYSCVDTPPPTTTPVPTTPAPTTPTPSPTTTTTKPAASKFINNVNNYHL